MFKKTFSRREFIQKNSLAGLGVAVAVSAVPPVFHDFAGDDSLPAILGGTPGRTKAWPGWPIWDIATDEKQVVEVLRKGVWCRAGVKQSVVSEFEKQWAEALGAKRCLAVVNGTNALIVALRNLNVGGRDEVIVTPYTFIATISAILEVGAMPVFADVDPETFQIDPANIEKKITPRTRAILPVHILGLPCDMIRIMEIARKHNLLVIEDTCQGWFAEINHRKVGTFGNAGCFSFQNSKHLAIGEGGAIVSDDDEFMDRCHSYHNCGRAYGSLTNPAGGEYLIRANNLRMTEYQAAIGLTQLKRLDEHTTLRNRNAEYLKSKISQIPGILPYKLYENVTRASFHFFPFRYIKEEFNHLTRDQFLSALSAEGIPAWSGYRGLLFSMPYLNDAFQSKNYQLMYPKNMLNFEKFVEQNQCPESQRLSNETGIWMSQNLLLGSHSDMDDIYNAIEKIHANSAKIKAGLSK
jgi:perosamine synthetase